MPTFDNIAYQIVEGRAEITLDRPEVLNAVDGHTLTELNEALIAAHDDPDAYVIVLTGRGRGFCSGGDLSGGYGDTSDGKFAHRQHLMKAQHVTRLLRTGPKPVVAAVNGPAVGSGCDFALAADLRVLSEEAFLREQFIDIGLIPGSGGAYLLTQLVGESKAREYVLTGRDITPEAAMEMGLAVEVVSPDETLEAARELANEVRDKPVAAARNAKALFDVQQSYDDHAEAALEFLWECINHSDQDEAVASVAENREPAFDRPYESRE